MVRGLLVVLLVLLALPGAAFAQEPGVNVDPDSPSGKEYAIPLDRARGQASPSTSGSQATPAPSTPAPSTSAPAASTPSGEGSSEDKGEEPKTGSQDTVLFGAGVTPESVKSGASDVAALTAAKAAADSTDTGVPPWLVAVVVAAVGVGTGVLVRWLRRRSAAG